MIIQYGNYGMLEKQLWHCIGRLTVNRFYSSNPGHVTIPYTTISGKMFTHICLVLLKLRSYHYHLISWKQQIQSQK